MGSELSIKSLSFISFNGAASVYYFYRRTLLLTISKWCCRHRRWRYGCCGRCRWRCRYCCRRRHYRCAGNILNIQYKAVPPDLLPLPGQPGNACPSGAAGTKWAPTQCRWRCYRSLRYNLGHNFRQNRRCFAVTFMASGTTATSACTRALYPLARRVRYLCRYIDNSFRRYRWHRCVNNRRFNGCIHGRRSQYRRFCNNL